MSVRVRFAPSPTGYLHLGVARTALFNWIYARSAGGTLILRIEDTDEERSRPEAIRDILDLTSWLGIDFDEGPYFQSERKEKYRAAAAAMLKGGYAYLCDAENNEVQGDELADGLAVRFRMGGFSAGKESDKESRTISFEDKVRGEVSFDTGELEDFVIWRSNGTPTFLLSNAVDDLDMGITHAIRGEDLLSSTPKILLLFEALAGELGGAPPVYAHLPLLVNESRQKLSKRRDDVSLGDWKERGYLPEAMANYLALLGWGASDNIEIRPMPEIIELFRLEDIGQSPAFFDRKKAEHFNAAYIRDLPLDRFIELSQPWLEKMYEDFGDKEVRISKKEDIAPIFREVAESIQSKIRTLSDIPRFVDWLFLKDPHIEGEDLKALKSAPDAAEILTRALEIYESVKWDAGAVHEATKEIGAVLDLSLGKAQMPIRVSITGRKVGPPLFESMILLEREEIIRRLNRGLEIASGNS